MYRPGSIWTKQTGSHLDKPAAIWTRSTGTSRRRPAAILTAEVAKFGRRPCRLGGAPGGPSGNGKEDVHAVISTAVYRDLARIKRGDDVQRALRALQCFSANCLRLAEQIRRRRRGRPRGEAQRAGAMPAHHRCEAG